MPLKAARVESSTNRLQSRELALLMGKSMVKLISWHEQSVVVSWHFYKFVLKCDQ